MPSRGSPVAIAVSGRPGDAIAAAWRGDDGATTGCSLTPADLDAADSADGPRWVWWDGATPRALVTVGQRVRRCWDLAAVHRILVGGWRADPGRVWAEAHGLDPETVPADEPPTLFSAPETPDDAPVRPDGHLGPAWASGRLRSGPSGARRWAELALEVQEVQQRRLASSERAHHLLATAHAESAAELVAAELEHDGLPIDVAEAERVLHRIVGPRPSDPAAAAAQAAARDRDVLRLVPDIGPVDLRNPAQVRSLLRRVGIEVADTRAWRLEPLRHEHPVVDALLAWRKRERIATTFGYGWLDEHVRDGRLRGAWTGADGAAGRMTATAGLHNLPTELRSAVAAPPGHVLVRSDLGQVEPRVLAAVSGDPALAAATADADLYLPVARRLGVPREVAKVAVLGAMYGQTTGHGAAALRALETAYPVAMDHLRAADEAARAGRDLVTYGGRRIRTDAGDDGSTPPTAAARSRAAARGRYGRNAVVQGAAAELFKTWTVLVRNAIRPLGATIVLCLHDELLVEAQATIGDEVAAVVRACLDDAVARWAPPTPAVRFVADVDVVRRWSDVPGH